MKVVIAQCTYLTALQPLLTASPPDVLLVVLTQFDRVLPSDRAMRRQLVQTGGLRAIQELDTSEDAIAELVESINSNYPDEVRTHTWKGCAGLCCGAGGSWSHATPSVLC